MSALPTSASNNIKRQRKTNGKRVENGHGVVVDGKTHFAVAASFVSTPSKRGLKKMKAQSAEFNGCHPLLTITTDHHISVVGKCVRDDEGQRTTDDSVADSSATQSSPSTSSYREFSSLQYSSRPGKSGSFFPSDDSELPRIPAILDAKNDLVYGLQHNNQRLCCWNMWEGNGPDDKNALKVDLLSPALSMSLLPMNKGLIYGTCQNGIVFVARILCSTAAAPLDAKLCTPELSIEYLPYQSPERALHIGTCAEIHVVDKSRFAGRKRKMSDAETSNSSVTFYQAFCDDSTIQLVRHDTQILLSTMEIGIKSEGSEPKVSTIVDVGSGKFDEHRYSLSRAEMLVSDSSTNPTVTFIYTVSGSNSSTAQTANNGNSDQRHGHCVGTFCTTVSLATAAFVFQPIRVGSDMNQFSLVTEKVLACASKYSISLHDLRSGALISSKPLTPLQPTMDADFWAMKSDTKTSTIAVLYSHHEHEDFMSLSATNLLCSDTNAGLSDLKASALLTGSLLTSSPPMQNENSVEDALGALEGCKEKLKSCDVPSLSFCQVFDECVLRLTNNNPVEVNVDDRPLNGDITPRNPQDPSTPAQNGTNGLKKSSKGTSEKTVDAEASKGMVKSSKGRSRHDDFFKGLPQSFIDGCVQLSCDAIHSSSHGEGKALSRLGYDARIVLRRLLRSGRVSARLLFEGSYSLRETMKKHPLYITLRELQHPADDNPLSAMQLVVEMLQNCSDLSERQLVIMMDYMMRFPEADDIAQTFAESTAIEMQHMLRRDSKRYMSVRGKRAKASRHHNDLSQEAEVEIERNLIVAGAELVMHMILCYSECNDVMLRIALSEGLDSPVEAIVMAQLLSRMLKSSPSNAPSTHRKNPNFVRTTCRWIASLCESFEDDLKGAKSPSGSDYLTYLRNAVQCAVRNSQAIISFKDGIGVAEAVKKGQLHRTDLKNDASAETNLWSMEEDLPGYSIDRLVF